MKGEVHRHLEESIRPYIDLIDTLRSAGIHKDLALPTIVAIGDQSSGKSSVLEALSGVALPTKQARGDSGKEPKLHWWQNGEKKQSDSHLTSPKGCSR